jgi:hypothetical protein
VSVQRESRGEVEVATADREITAQAGAVLLRQAAKAVGLARSIGEHLRLKKRAGGMLSTLVRNHTASGNLDPVGSG